MLYQDVRPKTFEDVIGNTAEIRSLQKLVKNKKHPHVYLFQGPSGCGKTTLARILAEAFKCSSMNIREINAAQLRGIDTIRDLQQNVVPYAPMGGGSRMIIFDEAHMMTRDAQNGLLKMLEDIYEYQYYVLCSTEPKKIINTIRTRSNIIEVKKLNDSDMLELLETSIEKTNMEAISDSVYSAILAGADGCPRSALMLLEKQAGLKEQDALKITKGFTEDTPEAIELCRALINKKDWNVITTIYKKLKDIEPEGIRRMLLGYLHTCLLNPRGISGDSIARAIGELSDNVYDSGKAGILSAIYFARKALNS